MKKEEKKPDTGMQPLSTHPMQIESWKIEIEAKTKREFLSLGWVTLEFVWGKT